MSRVFQIISSYLHAKLKSSNGLNTSLLILCMTQCRTNKDFWEIEVEIHEGEGVTYEHPLLKFLFLPKMTFE